MRINTTLLLAGQQQADKQWGLATINASEVVFPISFSDIRYSFVYSLNYGSGTVLWDEVLSTPQVDMTSSTYRTKNKQQVGSRVSNWIAIGKQQWGMVKIQPPGSVVNLNISCDIYCISAASIDGDWPYIKLIDNTQFKIVVNAQKAFWICLGILKQQWGYVDDASNYSHIVELSFTIAFATTPYIIDTIMALKKESNSTFFFALPVSVTNTTAKLYYGGYGSGSNNTRGYFWLAIGN